MALEVSRVKFSSFIIAGNVSNKLPDINMRGKLSSSDLYIAREDGVCPKCISTTSYCRGHMGKISLRSYHISRIYRNKVKKLLDLICPKCSLPVKTLVSSAKLKVQSNYVQLVRAYSNNVCRCTGTVDQGKSFESAIRLIKVYTYLAGVSNSSLLSKVFHVGTPLEVLRECILVPPLRLLEQMPGGTDIYRAYCKLLALKNNHPNFEEEEHRRVDAIYAEYEGAFKGKIGFLRQVLVPRRLGNSGRGVMVSNPNIGLCDIVIPDVLARNLSSSVIIARGNLQFCINAIISQRAISVDYDKHRYRFSSNCVYVNVMGMDIPEGSALMAGTTILGVVNNNNIAETVEILNGYECNRIVHGSRCLLELGPYKMCTMYVDVSSDEHPDRTCRIPLQIGAGITLPCDGQSMLVHRNPVLSAGSMHIHNMIIASNPQSITMSNMERHLQRLSAGRDRYNVILGSKSAELDGNAHNIVGTRMTSSAVDPSISIYEITTTRRRVYTDAPVTNCSLGLHPLAVTSYQGDFDGDEMNISKIDREVEVSPNVALVGDLRKGSFGLTHDAKYGCYLVTHNVVKLNLMTNIGNIVERCESMEEILSNVELYPNAPDFTQWKESLDIASTFPSSFYLYLASFAMPSPFEIVNEAVLEFVVELRSCKDRKNIVGFKAYNNYFADYVDHNVIMLRNVYPSISDLHIVSKFYSDVSRFFCSVCDHYSVVFDRRNLNSLDNVMLSEARPNRSTIANMYGSVGVTSYALPRDKIKLSMVKGNYITGLTEDEYLELCYSNRMQAITKATAVAPEGDNMRLICNYMSDISVNDNTWYYKGFAFYESVSNDSVVCARERDAIANPTVYSNVLPEDYPRLPYRCWTELPEDIRKHGSNIIHIGQRKLLMSEIDFLTDYGYGKECLVVYAGAASGSHIPVLLSMFPTMKFHLYDTSDFAATIFDKVSNRPRRGIRLFKKFLTVELARNYANHAKSVLYISDIRTRTASSNKPTDEDVAENNSLNADILDAMIPQAAMLKFRLPYAPGVSMLPMGELRFQCWSGRQSTEARLVCSRPYSYTEYDHTEHEEKMYYHNLIRPHVTAKEKCCEHLSTMMNNLGRRLYYDTSLESAIVRKYMRARGCTESYVYRCMESVLGDKLDYYLNRV